MAIGQKHHSFVAHHTGLSLTEKHRYRCSIQME
jgi:hypothetical protein